MQKTVPEVLKTWYFSYSAFWSTGLWGGSSPHLRPLWLRYCQTWSPRGYPRPRGHILKFLASKVKILALASKLQVFENCPDLGSRTALFFEPLKFCWKTPETSRKIWEDLYCFPRLRWPEKDLRPFFSKTFAPISLVLGLERVCPRKGCPWPRIFLCPWPWPQVLCPRLHLC